MNNKAQSIICTICIQGKYILNIEEFIKNAYNSWAYLEKNIYCFLMKPIRQTVVQINP